MQAVIRYLFFSVVLCITLSVSADPPQNALEQTQKIIVNQPTVDSSLFYSFAHDCLNSGSVDLLMNTYRQITETGQKDFTPTDIPILKEMCLKFEHKPLNENSFHILYFTGRVLMRYHLDSAGAYKWFDDAISIARKLNDNCLLVKGYYGLGSYYMNIKHDILKTNECLETVDELLKKNHQNGIIDCNVDINVAYSVLYYYLEDHAKMIEHLTKSIATVRFINKPQRLFDLYGRLCVSQALLERYNDALHSLDTAEQIAQTQPNKTTLLNFTLAERINIFIAENKFDSAQLLSKGVDIERLKIGKNDEYYDYMRSLIKMNINFNQLTAAEKNIELYKSSLKGWRLQRWESYYEFQYLLSKAKGNNAEALNYYEKYNMMDDSVHHQKQNFAVLSEQIKYHTREKEEELKLQIAANVIQSKNINLIIAGSVALSLILLLALVYRINSGLREKEKLNKNFTQKLLLNTEKEQNRLANELHDGLGQELLLLKNGLLAEHNEPRAQMVAEIIESVRGMARELYPALLEVVGLKNAIENQLNKIDQTEDIFISSNIEFNGKLEKTTELQVFRIFQEAMSNVLKYSKATSVYVGLFEQGGVVIMTIKDNGIGFPIGEKLTSLSSFGLQSMQRRAESINGKLTIDSSTEGTEIKLAFKKNGDTRS